MVIWLWIGLILFVTLVMTWFILNIGTGENEKMYSDYDDPS